MKAVRMFKTLLLAFVALHSFALAEPEPPGACRLVVEKILKGESFTMQGFELSRIGTLKDGIVLRMNDGEWHSTLSHLKADLKNAGDRDFMTLTRETLEKQLGRGSLGNIRDPYFTFRETPEGLESRGTRYMLVHSSQVRVFKLEVRESLTRNGDGLVAHYASVRVYELNGSRQFEKIAYADFPHLHGRTPRWFHMHEERTNKVIGNIATPGFVKSVVPDTVSYFRDAVKNGLF